LYIMRFVGLYFKLVIFQMHQKLFLF
jgi:hypothetical protein